MPLGASRIHSLGLNTNYLLLITAFYFTGTRVDDALPDWS
jgi:hypothetical protein